ncbi:AzlD domain-containing protein [Clostridium botulinum]|jgi:Predicted membrane protein|uniref:AzlD domain-containing protein n=1 Tax=Companilactobacillus zhachilii TaxID=2304606 RepID=A0A386PST6_9LACO|nr:MULTISPECIES: AzlD domain-containing protein [Bacillota]AYE37899.1 AzlD domain-containing protein [Companilactobacillus zhachilii]MBL3530457.1 AzlD domain-containing protein [Companilactobacillus zhachilii]MCS6109295.1 AzlD domain-containing protein [Clostridium botulinum]
MPSTKFVLWTLIACGLVTWLSRILPFVLLKKFNLPAKVVEFLSFVPITIMAALWFENLFHQNLGHLPTIDYANLIASVPTVLTAILTKKLLLIVIVGIISLALVRLAI